MKKLKNIACMAASALAALALSISCTKDIDDPGQESSDNHGTVTLKVQGLMGELSQEAAKAEAVDNIRVSWAEGDTVLVFQGKKYLGSLTATLDGEEDRVALLSGTIREPSGSTDLTFIYGTGIVAASYTADNSYDEVSQDFSAQSGDKPFVVYGTAAYSDATATNLIVPFKFASSLLRVGIIGLTAGENVLKVQLSGVSTVCKLALNENDATPAVSGVTSDTITVAKAVTASSDGDMWAYVGVPASEASSSRTIKIIRKSDVDITIPFKSNKISASRCINDGYRVGKDAALESVFSVSATQKVRFSRGNLQAIYDGSSYNWNFAYNQYDCVGDAPGNTSIGSLTGGDKVDLFGWVGASSSVLTSDAAKYGITTNTTYEDYGDSDSDALKSDWGVAYCTSKGITPTTTWYTLTKDGWDYLLNSRTVNGGTGPWYSYINKCAKGVNIDGSTYYGLFLLPDGYAGTVEMSLLSWNDIDEAGIVFLPAAGGREGSGVGFVGKYVLYWTSTPLEKYATCAYMLVFDEERNMLYNNFRIDGQSVRLVTNAD